MKLQIHQVHPATGQVLAKIKVGKCHATKEAEAVASLLITKTSTGLTCGIVVQQQQQQTAAASGQQQRRCHIKSLDMSTGKKLAKVVVDGGRILNISKKVVVDVGKILNNWKKVVVEGSVGKKVEDLEM